MKTIMRKGKVMVLMLGLLAASSLLPSCGFIYCGSGEPDPVWPIDPVENPEEGKPICEG